MNNYLIGWVAFLLPDIKFGAALARASSQDEAEGGVYRALRERFSAFRIEVRTNSVNPEPIPIGEIQFGDVDK